MQPLVEHRLEFAGYDTRVLELEGEGPPVILLHGFSDSADTWRLTLDELARRDLAAVAVDLPGFAAADPLGEGSVMDQLHEFGRALVEHYAPRGGAVVSGNSLGGCMALRLAEEPDLDLAGVVPVAPAGLDMAPWIQIIERDPVLRRVLSSPVPVPRWVIEQVTGRVYRAIAFAHPRAVDQKLVASFTAHFKDRATAARFLENGRRLYPELIDCLRLERVECPVLVVWGRQDRMVYARGAHRILDAVPGARVELIDDCGHCPQVECPDRFAELLIEFLEPIASRAA